MHQQRAQSRTSAFHSTKETGFAMGGGSKSKEGATLQASCYLKQTVSPGGSIRVDKTLTDNILEKSKRGRNRANVPKSAHYIGSHKPLNAH